MEVSPPLPLFDPSHKIAAQQILAPGVFVECEHGGAEDGMGRREEDGIHGLHTSAIQIVLRPGLEVALHRNLEIAAFRSIATPQ
jgi:hypothetical protein